MKLRRKRKLTQDEWFAKLDRDMAKSDKFPFEFKREMHWPFRLGLSVVRQFTSGGRERIYQVWSFARWQVKLVVWRSS